MLRNFLDYYRPYKRLLWLDLGASFLSGLLELAFPIAIALFIDKLLPQGNWSMTIAASIALLVIYLLNTSLMAVVIYWGHKLGINIETDMRKRAFDHLLTLDWAWFDRSRTGDLIGRVTRDLDDIGEAAHHGPEDLIVAVMTFVGALVLMMMLHVQLAGLTLVIVPLTLWVVIKFGGNMAQTWRGIYKGLGQFNTRIEQAVSGIRVVQAFANENHERRQFAQDNQDYRRVKLKAYEILAQSAALHYMGLRFVQIILMVAGAYFVLIGDLQPGSFVGFLLLVGVFFRPLEKIAAVIETYPKGIAGFGRLLELLATQPRLRDCEGAVDAPDLRRELRFENISLAYDGQRAILSDINLSIKAGETVAFVGPSGAGKTSLLSLLPRFYEQNTGRISIDGVDCTQMKLQSLREKVGLVSQDLFLFGTTLRDNIRYGCPNASDAEVLEAAQKAQLGSMIEMLPNGLDTIIGERGVTLSGGQKQRVAIARVFLKDPPILILDEATSALDTATEREIQAALDDLSKGRTTLVIAHRLATIKNADRIVVMDHGRIVEFGTHQELLAQGATYARLSA